MKPRRRIFRSASSGSSRWLRTLLLAVLATGGVGALMMTALSTNLFGRAPPPPSHLAAEASAVAVVDGDTLMLGGQVIRLHGVDAPDRGERCLGDLDCGSAATSVLAGLVRGRRVDCAMTGTDRAGRPYADCQVNGTDLSRAIVASGWARAQADVPELADLELRARRQRTGLWADAAAR